MDRGQTPAGGLFGQVAHLRASDDATGPLPGHAGGTRSGSVARSDTTDAAKAGGGGVAEANGRLRVVTLLRRDLQRRWSKLGDDPSLEVVATSDAGPALDLSGTAPNAVLLVDARVVDECAFDIAAAHALDPAPILIAARSARIEDALSYVAAGAAGCVLTGEPVTEVASALRAAAAGALVVPRDVIVKLITVLIDCDLPAPPEPLRFG